MAEGAGAAAVPTGAMRVGAVFNDDQVVFFGEGEDGVHIGHVRAEVDGDDGPGARGDGLLGEERVEAVIGGVDIDDDRDGAGGHGSGGGGLEGVGWDDDFIAPADAGGAQGDFHGNRTVGHGDGITAALHEGEFLGELGGARAGIGEAAPAAGFDDSGDGVDVALVPGGPGGIGLGA